MASPSEEPIDIAGRPFLSRLARDGARPAGGGSHLVAAATGNSSGPQASEPAGRDDLTHVTLSPVSTPSYLQAPQPSAARRPEPPQGAGPAAPLADVDPNRADLDWDLVRQDVLSLQLDGGLARDRTSFDVAFADAGPETAQEEDALKQIRAMVEEHATRDVLTRGDSFEWTALKRAAHAQAVFDEAFRYGRLSPLLREEDVESFNVYGSRKVVVIKAGGLKEDRPPISRSDDELDLLVNRIASDRGRTYSLTHGKLRLDLGGARLTALGGPVQVPETTIAVRRHTMPNVTLAQLVGQGMLTPNMAEFLTAAVAAHMSNLVSGWAETGKTTMLRALMSAVPRQETIVSIETERELYLDKQVDDDGHPLHPEAVTLQYMPSNAIAEDSEAAFPLDEALEYAKRYNAQTFVFGEILGPKEANTAVSAFQSGKGTNSTIHAKSPKGAIAVLSRFLVQSGGLSDNLVPQQEILDSISFIVQLGALRQPDGTIRRIVSQIAQVQAGDSGVGRVKAVPRVLFRYDRGLGAHVAVEQPKPDAQEEMLDAGLREDFFQEWSA